jgi:hypothetical protein
LNATQRRAAIRMAAAIEPDPRRERYVPELLRRWSWRAAGLCGFAFIGWLAAQGV